MATESKPTEPRVEARKPKKYRVDVMIPPECLDEDGGKCEHDRKSEKKQYNPV